MIPRFRTALSEPLYPLEQALIAKAAEIEAWFEAQWQRTPPPFYGSVDLRHAGYKLAPVDTNLFPASFNNLGIATTSLCIQAVHSAVEQLPVQSPRILVIPESHTRNQGYMESLAKLKSFIEQAGFMVRVGSLSEEITAPTILPLSDGNALTLEPVCRQGNRLGLFDYDPDLIVVNNAFFPGIPQVLQNLEQLVVPPLEIGWSIRRKFQHFSHYQRVAENFGEFLKVDPWLIDPYFSQCTDIDFHERRGEDWLAQEVAEILKRTAAKYQEYGISEKPFVIVKADPGSYGMGVMTIRHPEEIWKLNRRQRDKMAVTKANTPVTSVLIQEGIYTLETVGEATAEPAVYMVDRCVVGGFYRVHAERGRDENLNTPGRHFVPLTLEGEFLPGQMENMPVADRSYAYGVVARLALLAAARELAAIQLTREQSICYHPVPLRFLEGNAF